jgi:hypothetical protein
LAQDDGSNGALAFSTDALGGGIFNNGGDVTLDNVVLRDNLALGGSGTFYAARGYSARGGGLYSTGGMLTISHSFLLNNEADGGMGDSDSVLSGDGGDAQGGGLYSAGGSLTLIDSSVVANTLLAGDAGPTYALQGGTAEGAGWYIDGSATVSNSTIATNSLQGGAGGLIGGNAQGGGLYVAASARLSETLLRLSTFLRVGGTRAGSASVLLGNGDGTFQAPRNFPVGNGPIAVAVADFNGDV